MTKSLSDNLYKGVTPIANGGTGSNSASAALTALGAQAKLVSGTDIKTINGNSVLDTKNFKFAGLSPTTVQTSLYTASKGQLVRCDTSVSAFTVNLPSSPTDGDIIGFSDVNGTFGTFAVTVISSGSTIENDTSLILNISGITISVMYHAGTNNWKVMHTRKSTWAGVPNTPIIGTVTVATPTSATIPVTAPYNGGSAITSYTATSSPGGLTGTLSGAASGNITVSNLLLSTSYTFTVIATNAFGNSLSSNSSNSITTPSVPNQPTIGTVVLSTYNSVTIPFTAPYDGGTPIISFTVKSLIDSISKTIYQSGNGSFTLTNLLPGCNYTFTVIATNAAGSSVASSVSNSISTPAAPSQPTIGTVTLSDTTATIPVTAPYDGGSAITGYTATSSPGGLTGTLSGAAGGNITITGLSYNTSYTFTVIATNIVGNSIASGVSNSITPLPHATSVDYVVAAGGGGGGGYYGGGGGAGGVLASNTAIVTGTIYTVTVGGAGWGSSNGGTSQFGVITATGGGHGGWGQTNPQAAASGGSGGGASAWTGTVAGASGTSGQGNSGGQSNGPNTASGGGGGAGGAGGGASNATGGGGGSGISTFIGNICGGGGGHSTGSITTVPSGTEGGGHGGTSTINAIDGTANTGGGGGGNYGSGIFTYGGSGVVGIRHLNIYQTATTTGSPTITDDGTYKIYKFTGSGTIKF